MTDLPEVDAAAVPWLSVAQMVEVDRVMTDDLGVTLSQMMENAGRGVAVLARCALGGLTGGRVRVLAGTGGNGGGGLAAARHLHVAGAEVDAAISAPPAPGSTTAAQLAILERLSLPVSVGGVPAGEPDVVVDAVLGYGQRGAPRGAAAALVEAAAGPPVLALDAPSGVELATGEVHTPAIRADATLTLAAPKHGLALVPEAVGALHLADISVPPAVLRAATGVEVTSPFGRSPLVRLRR